MTSIIFMGTPQFSAPILKSLIDSNYEVLAVVTQPDRPVGRKKVMTPSPVKRVATEANIEVLQPEKLSGSPEMARVIELAPDFIVTAAFGQFLPAKVLAAPKIAPINVHASLLPKYRGGAPVHYAVMNGDFETGVSIMEMVKKMDAGDVIAQVRVPITKQDDTGSMFAKLSAAGRDLLLKTLPQLVAGTAQRVKQDESQATFAPNIQPEQERIDFNLTAHQIDNKVRGLRPFPIGNVVLNGVRTKLYDVTPLTTITNYQPGQVVAKTKHELILAAGGGTTIQINELQPAGKPKMTMTDFLNGIHNEFKDGDQVIAV